MASEIPVDLTTVAPLRAQFTHWRETRTNRGAPMPDSLWAAAIEAAQRYGLAPTARALQIDCGSLERRQTAAGPNRGLESPSLVDLGAAVRLALAPIPRTATNRCSARSSTVLHAATRTRGRRGALRHICSCYLAQGPAGTLHVRLEACLSPLNVLLTGQWERRRITIDTRTAADATADGAPRGLGEVGADRSRFFKVLPVHVPIRSDRLHT